MIVDDHPTNLKVLRAMLQSEGYKVLEAADGVKALEVLNREKVDAVISDVLMPNIDGYQFCHEVQRDPRLRTIPIILYSNVYFSPAEKQMALDSGASAYLAKPTTLEELCDLLHKLPAATVPAAPAESSEDLNVTRPYSERLVKKIEEQNLELLLRLGELEKLAAELKLANADLETFAYSASHDLKTPLRTINGFSEILLQKHADQLNPDGKRLLDMVSKSAHRMEQIIEDLLEFSRISHTEMHYGEVDMVGLAHTVLQELKATCPERQIETSVGSLPSTRGAASLLRQVFINLIANAIKYTRPCSVACIEIGGRSEGTENMYWVRDNGIGFNMEYADKLFHPFKRLHSGEEFEGTGVGLAFVQKVIHRHGGHVWAEAKINEGATFYFAIPNREDPMPGPDCPP